MYKKKITKTPAGFVTDSYNPLRYVVIAGKKKLIK